MYLCIAHHTFHIVCITVSIEHFGYFRLRTSKYPATSSPFLSTVGLEAHPYTTVQTNLSNKINAGVSVCV